MNAANLYRKGNSPAEQETGFSCIMLTAIRK